jgi:hypothetical protein
MLNHGKRSMGEGARMTVVGVHYVRHAGRFKIQKIRSETPSDGVRQNV